MGIILQRYITNDIEYTPKKNKYRATTPSFLGSKIWHKISTKNIKTTGFFKHALKNSKQTF